MSDVLSNDQVEALVAAARGSGSVATRAPEAKKRRPRRVRDVDFTRPTKFAQDQQRLFGRAHETFCRSASTRMSAELRTPLELEVIDVDQLTWSSTLARVPQPSIYVLLEADPLGSSLLLTVELPLIMRMIDRMLGGSGNAKAHEGELTEIETAMTRRMCTTLVENLTPTWEDLLGLSLHVRAIESKLTNLHLAPPSEPTLTLTMEAKSESTSATLSLAVPYRSIEQVASRLASGQFTEGAPDAEASELLRNAVGGVAVEMRAEVARVEVAIEDLLDLKVGDVVRLGASAQAGVTLFADSVPVHRARPGRSGRRRAVEILENLGEGASAP
jgi:flagellar motor switch protein FliM